MAASFWGRDCALAGQLWLYRTEADRNTDEVLEVFPRVQAYARSQKVPCLAVFASEDSETVKKKVVSTRFGTTMFPPVTLRDIRMHFEDIGAVTR